MKYAITLILGLLATGCGLHFDATAQSDLREERVSERTESKDAPQPDTVAQDSDVPPTSPEAH
jgi:hypothetical protein